jgi:UDP-glucose 4-epimerase
VLWHLGFQLWQPRRRFGGIADRQASVEGTANVVAGRPRRVVFASSAAVYGAWPDNPLPLRETDPARPNPECCYAEQKLTAERLCRESAPALVLRIGAVLGAHADPQIARATRGYRWAVPAIRGAREALQFVEEGDVAAALLAAGRSSATGVCNVSTADWLSADDIARIAGGRVLRLPRRVLVSASEAIFQLRLLPFGRDRSALLNGPLALGCERASDLLDWQPTRRSADVLAEAVGR